MTFSNGLRNVCDVCFYLTFASIVGNMLGFSAENLIIALPFLAITIFLGGYLLEKEKNCYLALTPLIILPLIIPYTTGAVLVLVPIIIYMITCLPKLNKRLDQFEYEAQFKTFLGVYGVVLFYTALTRLASDGVATSVILPIDSYLFAIAFMTNAIVYTRMVRHDEAVFSQTKFKIINAAPMVGVIIVTVLVSTDFVLTAIGRFFSFVFINLLLPFFEFLAWLIIRPLGMLFNWLGFNSEFSFGELPAMENQLVYGEVENLFYGLDDGYASPWAPLVFGVLFIGVVIFLFRVIKARHGDFVAMAAIDEDVEEIRIDIESVRQRKKRLRKTDNPIRAIYRDFLGDLKKQDIHAPSHFTSAEIERTVAIKYPSPLTDELRTEYIKIRYGKSDFNKADVSRVKRLYQKIKSEINQK